jgi:hypothetical protein
MLGPANPIHSLYIYKEGGCPTPTIHGNMTQQRNFSWQKRTVFTTLNIIHKKFACDNCLLAISTPFVDNIAIYILKRSLNKTILCL